MPKAKPITINGQTFSSITAAITHFKLSKAKVNSRLYKGWTPEQAFELAPAPTSITLENINYRTILAAASAYGLVEQTIHTRFSRGWSLEQAFGLEAPPKKYKSAYNAYIGKHHGLKLCIGCSKEKLLADFYPLKRQPGAVTPRCRACVKFQVRNGSRKLKYGLDLEAWNQLFQNQDGKCAICKASNPGTTTHHWATDHCHTTGKVRGILCRNCNLLLGFAKDNTEILQAATAYLENNK